VKRLAAVVVLVVALAGCGSSPPERASGVTERWLQAISDSGRSRVRDDALERAAEDGDPAIADGLLPDDHDDDEDWFSDLEVGRAIEDGDGARVPLRLTRADDETTTSAPSPPRCSSAAATRGWSSGWTDHGPASACRPTAAPDRRRRRRGTGWRPSPSARS
jgi:hypothetical protein